MTRQTLLDRRLADIISFIHDERRWTASYGRFSDGRLAELFLDALKESPLADAARESAILVSLALQHGCAVETIRHALGGRDAGPIGAALKLIEPAVGTIQSATGDADLPVNFQRNGDV